MPASPTGLPNHMPDAPILILLAATAASPGTADMSARAGWRSDHPGAEPYPAGGAGGAPRRLRTGLSPRRKRPHDARGRRDRRLARSHRGPPLISYRARDHRPRRDPRGNRLARTAGVDTDRAGELGENPEPNRRARRRLGRRRRGRTGQGRRRARPGRGRGPARPPVWAASVPFG